MDSGAVVQVHHGSAALRALLPSWRALDARADDVPLAAELQLAAASGSRCVAITAHIDGALRAIWPLRVHAVGPVRVGRRLGGAVQTFDGPTVDHAPAGAPEQWRARLVHEMVRVMGDQRLADVLHVRFLADLPQRAGALGCARPAGENCWLDTRGITTTDALLARLSKERRKSTRRGLRALEGMGAVTFRDEPDVAQRRALVLTAIRLKREWLRATGEISVPLSTPFLPRRLLSLVSRPELVPLVRVFALEVGGELASVELGFRSGVDYQSYLGAFDARFAKAGPGAALTAAVLTWCGGHGVRRASLLPPSTEFKRGWTDQSATLWAATVPFTAVGRAVQPALQDAKALAKRGLNRAQAAWERWGWDDGAP